MRINALLSLQRSQRGTSLLVVMLLLLVGSVLIVSLYRSAEHEASTNRNQFNSMVALQHAERARIKAEHYILKHLVDTTSVAWDSTRGLVKRSGPNDKIVKLTRLGLISRHNALRFTAHTFTRIEYLGSLQTSGITTIAKQTVSLTKKHLLFRLTVSAVVKKQRRVIESCYRVERQIQPRLPGRLEAVSGFSGCWVERYETVSAKPL